MSDEGDRLVKQFRKQVEQQAEAICRLTASVTSLVDATGRLNDEVALLYKEVQSRDIIGERVRREVRGTW